MAFWENHPAHTGFRPSEERLIINVATATVLRPGIEEPSNKPNSLIKMKWVMENADGHADSPWFAVVRIHGGTVWTGRGIPRRYCPQETHVYDVSGLTERTFPYGSYAAQHGFAGTHWAGRATRIIDWEGR
ncbi:uncharacterized protein METZ01_LOCUS362443 [marine metagenome]|uniref:Uncharacterized protein n=1 Tax=marine metagenome TaxID=408172 RepID=A0A382SIA4_9ZZZZ